MIAPEACMKVTSLHRCAVKGLSGDVLSSVTFTSEDRTFQDDRRFALLFDDSNGRFHKDNPSWLHKVSSILELLYPSLTSQDDLSLHKITQENFLCAFTAPELLASLDTEYSIKPRLTDSSRGSTIQRILTIWDRKLGRTSEPQFGPVDLATQQGRDATSTFFTELCGKKVVCVVADRSTAKDSNGLNDTHTHQFGNTQSGVKHNNGDTRTIHIVNQNTVMQFSNVINNGGNGDEISATRFRPNIIVNNLEPWGEFNLVGKTIEVVPSNRQTSDNSQQQLRFRIVSRTVRCAGIGVDPLHPKQGILDIPKLLIDHFPEHGPYLGVYAIVDDMSCGGTISVGDGFRVVDN